MITYRQLLDDPSIIIGAAVPATCGGNFGLRVVASDDVTKRYIVRPIRWSTREELRDGSRSIAPFKLSYRYDLSKVSRHE